MKEFKAERDTARKRVDELEARERETQRLREALEQVRKITIEGLSLSPQQVDRIYGIIEQALQARAGPKDERDTLAVAVDPNEMEDRYGRGEDSPEVLLWQIDKLVTENDTLSERVEQLTAQRTHDAIDGQAALDQTNNTIAHLQARLAEVEAQLAETQELVGKRDAEWRQFLRLSRDKQIKTLREKWKAAERETQRLREALETIANDPNSAASHKQYLADNEWWASKRDSKAFESWLAQQALHARPAQGR